MKRVMQLIFRNGAAFAFVIAMVLSAFAHAKARAPLSPDLAAYLEAGGSLAEICGGAGNEALIDGPECEACRLLAAALLPSAVQGVALASPFAVLSYRPASTASLPERRAEHKRQSRAPPLS